MRGEYKNSGVEWIGDIPSYCEVIKFKQAISATNSGEVIDKNYWNDGDELLYTCQKTPMKSTFSDFPAHKRTVPGDLLLTRNATPYIFIPEPNSIYSNVVQRVKIHDGYSLRYLRYAVLLGAEALVVNGNTIPSYNMEVWRNISIPMYPHEQQQRIADYLDTTCLKIEKVLEQTRNTIEEYKRLKQSIITTAVVKGIKSDAKLKDTGIEWIGWIPAHWDDAKLKYFATLRAGVTLGKTYPNGVELVEVPYLRVANVQGSFVDLSDVATISVLPEEIEKYRLHKGEVLMTEGGDRDKLGRGCVWNGEIDPCLHQNHVFAVTTDPTKLLGQFLAYMTTSSVARTYFDITAKKTTNLACTNSTTILNFTMPIPPVEEQEEIVEYLDKKCTEVDALIAKKEQFLVELENYKKSLIYEYVTGKKEVPWDN